QIYSEEIRAQENLYDTAYSEAVMIFEKFEEIDKHIIELRQNLASGDELIKQYDTITNLISELDNLALWYVYLSQTLIIIVIFIIFIILNSSMKNENSY